MTQLSLAELKTVIAQQIIERQMLREGRLDDVKAKYPQHTDIVDQLSTGDVSGSYKYLPWMAKQVIELNEPIDEVIPLIDQFHRNNQRLQQKDLNRYNTLAELRGIIDALGTSKTKAKKNISLTETDVIVNDDEWLLVHPKTVAASQKFGAGSRWCIAATSSNNQFNNYTGRGHIFYFLVNKKQQMSDPYYKVALDFSDGRTLQIFNALDEPHNVDFTRRHIPEIDRFVDLSVAHLREFIDTDSAARAKHIDDPDEYLSIAKTSNDVSVLRALAKNPKIDSIDSKKAFEALTIISEKIPDLKTSHDFKERLDALAFSQSSLGDLLNDRNGWLTLQRAVIKRRLTKDIVKQKIASGEFSIEKISAQILEDANDGKSAEFGTGITHDAFWINSLPRSASERLCEMIIDTSLQGALALYSAARDEDANGLKSVILSKLDDKTKLTFMLSDTADIPDQYRELLFSSIPDVLETAVSLKDKRMISKLSDQLTKFKPMMLLSTRKMFIAALSKVS